MSRLTVQVGWMAVALVVALWLGWLWRFAPEPQHDAGCLVRKGEAFSIVPADTPGAFDDLIPKEGER